MFSSINGGRLAANNFDGVATELDGHLQLLPGQHDHHEGPESQPVIVRTAQGRFSCD